MSGHAKTTGAALGGLSQEQAEAARSKHGSNRLSEISGKTFWRLFLESLDDRTLKILIGAAIVVLLVDLLGDGSFIEGSAILLAVFVAALVSGINDWRAQSEFKSLQIEGEGFEVRVLRSGKIGVLSAFDLVVGDIVEVEAGQKVPADGRLVQGFDLEADESLLTGESGTRSKCVGADDLMRAGTMISSGHGLMRVDAVGEGTEYGRLRAQLAIEQEPTPLQQRLGRLADRIGIIGLGSALLIFIGLSGALIVSGHFGLDLQTGRELLTYAVMAVTIVVVAVPEGLPVAVTISLAYSIMKMAREKSLVRRLLGCETMGAVEVLCVDKTGTLTENQLRVVRSWVADSQRQTDGLLTLEHMPDKTRELFIDVAAIDSTAHIEQRADRRVPIGNRTETALLEILEDWGEDYRQRRSAAEVERFLDFSSDRKCMSTLMRLDDKRYRLLSKGAPEIMLPRCVSVQGASGPRPWQPGELNEVENILARWANDALRPLVLAYRDQAPDAAEPADPESDLVLIGMVGIGDPIRAEVPEAIQTCQKAGIKVIMITGDNPLTAEAVARRVKLIGAGEQALTGEQLRAFSAEQLQAALPDLRVVARAVPGDKLRIVKALQDSGLIVGVTGDGTNDGPALRHADIGLAMGLSGTDVAREASDIIILDDNFKSVLSAVRWGRSIFGNIRKFLQFQLTVNLVALVTAFVAAVTGQGTPLTVVQLLWVNLIMDTLAALALATEPPGEHLLEDRPHGHQEGLISRPMWMHMIGLGTYMLLLLMLALFTDTLISRDDPAHHSLVFNLFVCLQVGNLFNCRTTRFDQGVFKNIGRSHLFLSVVALIVVAQILIVEFGSSFFRTTPLSGRLWFWSVLLGASIIPVGAMLRWLGRKLPEDWPERLTGRLRSFSTKLITRRLSPWLTRRASIGSLRLLAVAGALGMLTGLALRPLGPAWRLFAFVLFSTGAAAIGCWLWSQREELSPKRLTRATRVRLHIALSILFALGLVAQLNYLASRHYKRYDLTSNRRFELSQQMRKVLGSIDQPLRLTGVFRPGSLAGSVNDLLEEIRSHGQHVTYQLIDPDRNPGEVERLTDRLRLKDIALSSLVVELGERHLVLAWQDLVERQYKIKDGKRIWLRNAKARFRGEEALGSAFLALTRAEEIRVCFATGHGERSPGDFNAEGLAQARDRLLRAGYTIAELPDLNDRQKLNTCHILIQAGPRRTINPALTTALEDYLKAGGKWLLTVEPWQNGGLEPLLERWGLNIRPVYLTDPKQLIAGSGPTTVAATNFQNHPITTGLTGNPLIFPYTTSVLLGRSDRDIDGANLVLLSQEGIGITDRSSRTPRFQPGRDRKGQMSMAAAVNVVPDYYSADVRGKSARIVLVGDTDFATNAHLHRGANADFLLNAVDWLARRDDLLGIRAKTHQQRRLSLSLDQQRTIFWTSLGLVPGLVGLLGAIVAWRRRR